MNKRLEKKIVAVKKAKEALANAIQSEQEKCAHKQVGECDYQPENNVSHAKAAKRVCMDCGFAEEASFKILTNKYVYKLTRNQVSEFTLA